MSDTSLSDIDLCKAEARKGAEKLHARATSADAKNAKKLTDAESAAIARKRIDEGKAR